MGCGDSHSDGPKNDDEEEAHLRELEAALGFQQHSSKHLDLYIRKYASSEDMNKNQYKLIGQKLNISLQNSEKLRTAAIYFSDLLFYKGIYDRTRLLIVAIMMGTGFAEEKAKLLFEIFDTEVRQEIQIMDATLLVSVMAKVSIEEVERLVSYEVLSALTTKKLQAYLAKINSVLTDVEKRMQETLFNGKDTHRLEGFVKAVSTQNGARMLSSRGIRKLAVEIYEEKVATRKKALAKQKENKASQKAKK